MNKNEQNRVVAWRLKLLRQAVCGALSLAGCQRDTSDVSALGTYA